MSGRCRRQEQEITRDAPDALRTVRRVRVGTRDAGHAASAGRLVCIGCGTIEEFADEAIVAARFTAALGHGFEVEAHVLELHGHCRECRPAGRLQGSC